MKKKCIVIYYKGLPIIVADVKELEPVEFIKIKDESLSNFTALLQSLALEKGQLNSRIEELEHQINVLKGEEE